MEERRLRVFENRVLRRVFGPKRDEVTGNGENYIMRSLVFCTPYQYCAGGKIEKNEMGGALASMGEGRGVHRVLVGKSEGKRPLGRPKRSGRTILKWIFRKLNVGGMDWIELAQDRDSWRAFVNAVMN
jgi:hypothetical protein